MKLRMNATLTITFFVICCFSSEVFSASFDCRKAATKIEKLICSDKKISQLDRSLASAYKAALKLSSAKEDLKNEQLLWLKNERAKCERISCLEQAYDKRIQILDAKSTDDIYKSAKTLKEAYESTLAKELLIREADRGNERALYSLAMLVSIKRNDIIPVLEKEAAKGDLDALFSLATTYGKDTQKNVLYAAEQGNKKAIGWLVGKHFPINDDFNLEKNAKTAYSYAKLSGSESGIDITLKRCAEADSLDIKEFLSQHHLATSDSPWKQARLISQKEPNPTLILQLVCLGGDVAFEKELAVEEAHNAWKKNIPIRFDGCSYAQSKYAMGGCLGKDRHLY